MAKAKKKKPTAKNKNTSSKLSAFIKRSQKNKLLVIFVVLFAAVGTYLLYNALAENSDSAWIDRARKIRYCESRHNYQDNDSGRNGHYGAWQFSKKTWGNFSNELTARKVFVTGDKVYINPSDSTYSKYIKGKDAGNYTNKIPEASAFMQDAMAYYLYKRYGFGQWACTGSGNPPLGPALRYPPSSSTPNPPPASGSSCPAKKGDYGGNHPQIGPSSPHNTACLQHLQYMLDLIGKYDKVAVEEAVTYSETTFGKTTTAGVKSFQKRKGLSSNPSGEVGPKTWAALHGACKYINEHKRYSSSGSLYKCSI